MLALKMLPELGFLEDSGDKLACFGLDSPRGSELDTTDFGHSHTEFLGWAHDLDLERDLGFHHQPGGQQDPLHLHQQGQALGGPGFLEHGQGKAEEFRLAQDVQRHAGLDRHREQQQHRGVGGGIRGSAGGQEGAPKGLQYPVRPGEPDCQYYLKTGTCAYGMSCKFNHPVPAWRQVVEHYPQRPGHPECQFYLANGTCRFGMTCKFHHPLPPSQAQSQENRSSNSSSRGSRRSSQGSADQGPALNDVGYPLRPGEKECAFFLKTGQCKFGATCKFHHPNLRATPPTDILPSNPVGMGSWPVNVNMNMPWPMSASAPGLYPFNQPLLGAPPFPFVPGSAPSVPSPFLPATQGPPGVLSMPGAHPGSALLPLRTGVADCRIYMKSGQCRYGNQCKFNHPPLPTTGSDVLAHGDAQGLELSATEAEADMRVGPAVQGTSIQALEQHQGQGEAGQEAQQQHLQQQQQQMLMEDSSRAHRLSQYLEQQASQPLPLHRPMPALGVSVLGLPLRPGAPPCPQYMQFSECRYGVLCPLDHPVPSPFPGMYQNAVPGIGMPNALPHGVGHLPPLESPGSQHMMLHLPSTLSASAASLAMMYSQSFKDSEVGDSPRVQGPAEEA